MFGYIPDYLLAIRKMDDVVIIEEAMMVPVVHRRFKSRRDFMEFSDKEFYELTRFTKEGATWVTDRLDNYLSSENNRGCPITPLTQVLNAVYAVFFYIFIFLKMEGSSNNSKRGHAP